MNHVCFQWFSYPQDLALAAPLIVPLSCISRLVPASITPLSDSWLSGRGAAAAALAATPAVGVGGE